MQLHVPAALLIMGEQRLNYAPSLSSKDVGRSPCNFPYELNRKETLPQLICPSCVFVISPERGSTSSICGQSGMAACSLNVYDDLDMWGPLMSLPAEQASLLQR